MAQVEGTQNEVTKKLGKATKGGTYYVLSWLPLLGIAASFVLKGAWLLS
jgi:hypothetical protein